MCERGVTQAARVAFAARRCVEDGSREGVAHGIGVRAQSDALADERAPRVLENRIESRIVSGSNAEPVTRTGPASFRPLSHAYST